MENQENQQERSRPPETWEELPQAQRRTWAQDQATRLLLNKLEGLHRDSELAALQYCMPSHSPGMNEARVALAAEARALFLVVDLIKEAANAQ